MTKKEIDEYIDFMCNPENSQRCEDCPENEDRSGRLLCGQQNCWVDMHCRAE